MKRIAPALGFSSGFSLSGVVRLRTMTFLAIILYPMWGALFYYLDPSFKDSMASRLSISVCFTLVLGASFHPRLKHYFDVLFVGCIWLLTTHYFNLIEANHGHYLYVSGAFLVIMAVLSAFPSSRSVYIFSVYVIAYSAFIVSQTDSFLTDPRFFLFGVFTCSLVGLASQSTLLKLVQTLHGDERLNNAILSNLVEGVVLRTADGSIISANSAASKIFGRTHKQMFEGRGFERDLFPINEDGTKMSNGDTPSAVALKTGKPQRGVTVGMKSDRGEIYWVKINAIPLFDEGETTPHSVLISYHDVTEQKNSDKMLIEQQALIANSARISSLGVMASGIAHEINNPLAIISGRVAQLSRMISEQSTKPEAMWPIIKNIEHTVQRISKIIQGLKAFSRDGHADPFVVTPVQQVLDDAIAVTKEILNRRGIELLLDVKPEIAFDGRSVQITQVLVNLIQNAADAIESLQTTKWIKVSAKDENADYIQITVEDSGSGVPKEIQGRVMEPFFTTKQVGKGTGLGLSISSGIVNAHNGSLYIDIDVPHTKFVISIPKSQKQAATAA